MAEAPRHLGIADHAAARLDAARQRLEESPRPAVRTRIMHRVNQARATVGGAD
jgi:hypothetical protein